MNFTPEITNNQPEKKDTSILEKFNKFSTEIQKLDADDNFVKASSTNKIYQEIFGKDAARGTTLSYRFKTLSNEFPDDILVEPDAKLGDSKYYIDRNNRELLKKIYFPAAQNQEDAQISSEMDHIKDIEALENLGILGFGDHHDEE